MADAKRILGLGKTSIENKGLNSGIAPISKLPPPPIPVTRVSDMSGGRGEMAIVLPPAHQR